MSVSVFPLPATGGGAVSGFLVDMGDATNFTVDLDQAYPAGGYDITLAISDATFDVYALDADGVSIGYTGSGSIVTTDPMTQLVILGSVPSQKYTFQFAGASNSATTKGNAVGAGAYVVSATPTSLPDIDDTTTVTGGNFATDVEVYFDDGATSIEAKAVTRNSATELIVTRPDSIAQLPTLWTLRVINPGVPEPTGSDANLLVDAFDFGVGVPDSIDYYVLGGGGGGGKETGGGGGGGEALTGVWTTAAASTSYIVTIGTGGGGAQSNNVPGGAGSPSLLGLFSAGGGGGGGSVDSGTGSSAVGAGGGGNRSSAGGTSNGSAGDGGAGSGRAGGGGGGATGNGENAGAYNGGSGGTGTADLKGVFRGGGGGGGGWSGESNAGSGTHGGGNGSNSGAGGTATQNYGAGGGGGAKVGSPGYNGGAGSSGIVQLRFADSFSPITTVGPGLTYTLTEESANGTLLYTFNAGSDTISW